MGRMSREKGKVGEREVAALLRQRGVAAQRGVQFQGGRDSPDVRCDLPGIHIEVKRTEKLALYPALDQATADAPEGAIPVVVHRQNNRAWVAILPFHDLITLASKQGAQS